MQVIRGIYASFDIIKNEDFKIILIEDFPCETKDQLRAREQYWIDNTECINRFNSYLTPEQLQEYQKQYRVDNREKIKQYCEDNKTYICERKKNYYLKNRDTILEKRKLYREEHENKERQREYMRQYRQRKRLKLQEQEETKAES
jgi:hypothetical protein